MRISAQFILRGRLNRLFVSPLCEQPRGHEYQWRYEKPRERPVVEARREPELLITGERGGDQSCQDQSNRQKYWCADEPQRARDDHSARGPVGQGISLALHNGLKISFSYSETHRRSGAYHSIGSLSRME